MPTALEKSILVSQKVEDLWGLLMDLRRAGFKVRNVGADPRGTYIYIEPEEDKDPTPIVEAWVGKVAPRPSALLRDIRVKELQKVEQEEAVRRAAEEEAARKLEEAKAIDGTPAEPEAEPSAISNESDVPADKVSLLKRIFRKFF